MPALAPQMRAKLARSAFELFAQRGFRDVNLDQIAAEAGVTKGSLYWHYKSKKELIIAACTHYYRDWQQQFHADVAAVRNPMERLQRAVLFTVNNCLLDRSSRVFTTDVFAMSLHDDEIRAGWAQFYDTARELFVGLVEAARADGKIEIADPRRAVDMMLAAFEGIKQRAAFEPQICVPSEREAMVEDLTRIVCGVPKPLNGGP